MKKEYIITFCISFLVLSTVVVISLMILVPQQTTVIKNNLGEYTAIKKSDYSFEKTNSISFDDLDKNYQITADEMYEFKANKQFVPGNSDPFSAPSNNTEDVGTGKNPTANGEQSNSSTTDKITNSNGGVANPESTTK